MSTFGTQHAALLAEYRSLEDEETTLWGVIDDEVSSATDPTPESDADMRRWTEVRSRRAELDRIFDALARRGA